MAALVERGIDPSAVFGDFDSLGYLPSHPHITQFDTHKDFTDLDLALQYAFDEGFDEMVVCDAAAWEDLIIPLVIFSCLSNMPTKDDVFGVPPKKKWSFRLLLLEYFLPFLLLRGHMERFRLFLTAIKLMELPKLALNTE